MVMMSVSVSVTAAEAATAVMSTAAEAAAAVMMVSVWHSSLVKLQKLCVIPNIQHPLPLSHLSLAVD